MSGIKSRSVSGRISENCPVRYPAVFQKIVQYPVGFQTTARPGIRPDFRKLSGSVSGRISENCPVSGRIPDNCPARYPAGFQEIVRSGIRPDFRKLSGPVSDRISGNCPVRYPTGFQKIVRSGIRPDKNFSKWLHISNKVTFESCFDNSQKVPAEFDFEEKEYFCLILSKRLLCFPSYSLPNSTILYGKVLNTGGGGV